MKIKNTKELKLRARSHAEEDHVRQGTYGEGNTNGKTKYEGCAVACLATPHRKDDLRAYIIEHGKYNAYEDCYIAEFDGQQQRDKIAREFGITERLMRVAEGLFEAQPFHGDAINFMRDFACALPEGADFTPRMVERWLKANLGWDTYDVEDFDYEDVRDSAESDIGEITKKFLTWVKASGKEVVAA